MRNDQNGFLNLRAATAIAAIALALAGLGAALATRQDAEAKPVLTEVPASSQDPSLAGLSVGPDAEPGGETETF